MVSLDPDSNGRAKADQTRWRRVLWNEVPDVIGDVLRITKEGAELVEDHQQVPAECKKKGFTVKEVKARASVGRL